MSSKTLTDSIASAPPNSGDPSSAEASTGIGIRSRTAVLRDQEGPQGVPTAELPGHKAGPSEQKVRCLEEYLSFGPSLAGDNSMADASRGGTHMRACPRADQCHAGKHDESRQAATDGPLLGPGRGRERGLLASVGRNSSWCRQSVGEAPFLIQRRQPRRPGSNPRDRERASKLRSCPHRRLDPHAPRGTGRLSGAPSSPCIHHPRKFVGARSVASHSF